MTTTAVEVELRYMTNEQAGRYCSVSRWSLLRASKAGYLTRYGSSASPRFLRDELDEWMQRGAPTTAAGK